MYFDEAIKWKSRSENKIRSSYKMYGEKIETEIYSATFKKRLPSHVWKPLVMPA